MLRPNFFYILLICQFKCVNANNYEIDCITFHLTRNNIDNNIDNTVQQRAMSGIQIQIALTYSYL